MNLLSANLHHGCQRCVIYYGFFPLVEKMGLNIETVVMVTNVNNAGGRLKWVVIVGRSSDPFSCYQKLFEEGAFKWAISKYHLLLFVALMDAFFWCHLPAQVSRQPEEREGSRDYRGTDLPDRSHTPEQHWHVSSDQDDRLQYREDDDDDYSPTEHQQTAMTELQQLKLELGYIGKKLMLYINNSLYILSLHSRLTFLPRDLWII